MRACASFQVPDTARFKIQLINWCNHFSTCCVLDSNQWNGNKNELIAGVGSLDSVSPTENSFEKLKEFQSTKQDWLFGHLSYDLKNETENLTSANYDGIGFAPLHFFQPEFVLILRDNNLEIHYLNERFTSKEIENIFLEISFAEETAVNNPISKAITSRISKSEYIQSVRSLQDHIRVGDVYELNYCNEFFLENVPVDAAALYLKLSEATQAPFSAFYRDDDKSLMCASPERFLKKTGSQLVSQPIKGTAKRGETDSEDDSIKKMLAQNEKEKSENVMIVDLVRNDLARSCNHVKVDELFGIYTFKQWHQMISTVSGELRREVHFMDALKNSFPMGSMTGAPKIRAMELIEKYEKTKRGLYSGAVGYITPNEDFDFNVVIRSILYNHNTHYLSFQVGSAITANAIPEKEYEECLLKAKGMFEALSTTQHSVQSTLLSSN